MVYFIQAVESKYIKIGKTNGSVIQRMKRLQNHEELVCLGTIAGDNRDAYYHHRFRAHRHQGEWFRAAGDLLDFIENLPKTRWTGAKSSDTDLKYRPHKEKSLKSAALTEQQNQVLNYIGHGLSAKETAWQLGIAHQTVLNHLIRIYEALGVASIYDLRELFARDAT
jgi:DNA-binding CsgD family transcriptional regulator